MIDRIRRFYRYLLLRRARQIRHGRNVKRAVRHQYQRLIELEAIAEADYSTSMPGVQFIVAEFRVAIGMPPLCPPGSLAHDLLQNHPQ